MPTFVFCVSFALIGFLLHTAKVLPYAGLDIPEKFNKGASLVYCNSILSKLWLAIEVNGDVLLTTQLLRLVYTVKSLC